MEGIPEPIKIDEKLIPLIDTVENGAIDLTELRNSSKEPKTITVQLDSFPTKPQRDPLFIVDGRTMPSGSLSKIKPETIKSIEVLKDEAATTLYGPEGKNGVILIILKNKEELRQGTLDGDTSNHHQNYDISTPGKI